MIIGSLDPWGLDPEYILFAYVDPLIMVERAWVLCFRVWGCRVRVSGVSVKV